MPSTKFKQIVETSDGFVIEGLNDNSVITAGGGSSTIDEEISIEDGILHFRPKEITFSSSSYNLTDKSNFVILIYTGSTNSTVTFDFKRKQTVYVINTNSSVSVITPYGALEGKIGHKFYCSELLAQWIYMGTFANELV